MSKIKRYIFLKRMYSDYVVILLNNNRTYTSYYYDLEILKYLGFNKNLSVLNKYSINYIVIDKLEIIMKKQFDDNVYMYYWNLVILNNIIKYIKNKYDNMQEEIG